MSTDIKRRSTYVEFCFEDGCEEKTQERKKRCRVHHAAFIASWNRMRKYGLEFGEYEKRVSDQENKCKLCGKIPHYTLRVDHDHKTGRVRGLLCGACNVAIGNLGDSEEGLLNALNYVRGVKWASK